MQRSLSLQHALSVQSILFLLHLKYKGGSCEYRGHKRGRAAGSGLLLVSVNTEGTYTAPEGCSVQGMTGWLFLYSTTQLVYCFCTVCSESSRVPRPAGFHR